jgi:hypothetical protein
MMELAKREYQSKPSFFFTFDLHLQHRQHTNHEEDYLTYIAGHHTAQKD